MNRQTMPTTFTAIVNALPMSGRPLTLCNNTTARLSTMDDMTPVVVIALHGHDIVRLFNNGTVDVRHCGYPTVTTFDRIKRFLPRGYNVTRQGGWPRVTLQGKVWDDVCNGIWTRCPAV